MKKPSGTPRREFVKSILQTSAGILCAAPAIKAYAAAPALPRLRPAITHGVMSGDVTFDSAVLWSRADRRSRMLVEWDTTDSFKNARRVKGPWAGEDRDFIGKVVLEDLPAGERIFYRVRFEDEAPSPFTNGQFVTASREPRDVFFAWSGDTCGQGYGINAEFGGLKSYDSMRRVRPDFFIHSGDNIYADGVIEPEMMTPSGVRWKNLTTPEKSKVAETLDEFRGNYRYNLLDANVREFNSEVPIFSEWDDHEVLNNWYLGRSLMDDNRYTEKDIDLIARRATRAFFEYMPIANNWRNRIYRSIKRGPLCEVFMLDQRSYRGPNSPNRQPTRSRETDFLGRGQLRWLKQRLQRCKATWKVIAADMPIGLMVGDGKNARGESLWENCANGNGPALGRELEIADLLQFIQEQRIQNVFWVTADVHYAASHFYDPSKAQFTKFEPFWEFVSGPLHAASLSPGGMDNTFGPQAKWASRKRGSKASGPYTNEQYFSTVRIDSATKAATVTHLNRDGEKLWSIELPAAKES